MKRTRLSLDPLMLALLIPAAFFGYLWSLVTGFAAVVVHECSHALAARLFGIRTERIDLSPFGGISVMDDAPNAKAAFFIAITGPLTNLLIAQLLLLIYRFYPAPAVQMLFIANLGIGLFNLLPAYPLDGGRILHILLTPLLGYERAKRLCCYIGMLLAGMLLAFAVYSALITQMINLSYILVGAMLLFMAKRQLTTDVYTALKRSQRKRKMLRSKPISARQVAASGSAVAMDLLGSLQKGQYLSVYVLDDGMKVVGTLDETEILDGIVRFGSTATLKKILDHR